jgi:DNA-binding HxlR family transcriptional regulator
VCGAGYSIAGIGRRAHRSLSITAIGGSVADACVIGHAAEETQRFFITARHVRACSNGATTRGTASQAIKALEAGGYLVRQRSPADGRSVTLRLTNKGNKAIARDPFEVLVHTVGSLDAEVQTAMHDALHRVLTTLRVGRIGTSVFARTAPTSVVKQAAAQRAQPPSNACCSASRSSRMTLVSSAFIFSQRANTGE